MKGAWVRKIAMAMLAVATAASCAEGSMVELDSSAIEDGDGGAAQTATSSTSGSGNVGCAQIVLPVEDCATPEDDDCDGFANMADPDAGCVCDPGATQPCYDGAPGTEGKGPCHAGQSQCASNGKTWGPCQGEVVPATEDCKTPEDEDCSGTDVDVCICPAGALMSCYTGPTGTDGIGICKHGVSVCAWDSKSWMPCSGEVVPAMENCATPEDDDCDGAANMADPDAGCVCDPGATQPCYDGAPGTEGKGPCHAGQSQCASNGKTWGPCQGQVVPLPENCNTPADENCDGTHNCPGPCTTNPDSCGLYFQCVDGLCVDNCVLGAQWMCQTHCRYDETSSGCENGCYWCVP